MGEAWWAKGFCYKYRLEGPVAVTAGVSWFWLWEKLFCWNWRMGGGVLAVERAEAYGSEFSKF